MNRRTPRLRALALLCLVLIGKVWADAPALPPNLADALTARSIGPANMGGRITALTVVEDRPATFYAATASGGLWKTTDGAVTWAPLFDHEATVSLGDVAVAPSNPDVVWVGTGEANPRNSVSWGDGVYKSVDGGKTWKNMGLRDTHHIGRIVVHPKTPDVVWVAALGHVWAPNRQRGLFKTSDGGKTWEHVKYLDDDTGFSDLALDPGDPDVLYAAAYRVRRDAYSGGNPAQQFGPAAGLYRSKDGGKTWARLTRGLPEKQLGRCGLSVYRKDPRILYAVVQTEDTLLDRESEWGQPARTSSQASTGGVFRSTDRGETWVKVNDLCPRPFYFSQVRVDPADDQRVYVLGVNLHVSRDGGKTFRKDGAQSAHADHHALWIDPSDPAHLILGTDGGVFFSADRGMSWEHARNLPIGQFYALCVDQRRPYRVYGGLQDNGTWGGPSRTTSGEGVSAADWFRVYAMDGFHCQVDPDDADTLYCEGQYGGLRRVNVRTGAETEIRPRPPADAPAYRFNWSAPLLVSPHRGRPLYFAGNHVFKSTSRGDRWETISPDLTRGNPGPYRNMGHTITALVESPLKPGLLYAGTDDGRVHVTRNGGAAWVDVSGKIPDVPRDRCITRIECSRFAEGTAYLALSRHRDDDRAPYVFKTEDYGATWKALANNLPAEGPVHVIREDLRNRDLLFVGTEFGLFASLDGGGRWQPLRGGLPTVAVHDLVIHPRERELVIGTHGRSVYILDIAPLQEWTSKVLEEAAHLFDVKPGLLFAARGPRDMRGGKNYVAPNPPPGAAIYFSLKETAAGPVRLTVSDGKGNVLREFSLPGEAGLHHVLWNLRRKGEESRPEGAEVPAGEYTIQLQVGEQKLVKKVRVEADE
jgi:photosystem II stability/assembly factor-like uncharacterized protein